MKLAKLISSLMLLCFCAMPRAQIPDDSIYQLESQWLDQDGKTVQLGEFAGKTQLVSMIYTHCLHTCPTIVSTMQAVELYLAKAGHRDIGFILVSLTPDSDTPEVLKAFALTRKLDLGNWRLLSGSDEDVRELAMAMDIKYQAMGDEVNHANLISVLDSSGRLLFQEIGAINNAKKMAEAIENM
jgi:protein SCO1/2